MSNPTIRPASPYQELENLLLHVKEFHNDLCINLDVLDYDLTYRRNRQPLGPMKFPSGYLIDGEPVTAALKSYAQCRLDAMRDQCFPIEVIIHSISQNQHPPIRRLTREPGPNEFFEFCGWILWDDDMTTDEQLEIVNHMEKAMKRTGWTNTISVLRDKSDDLAGYYCFFDSADSVNQHVADMSWRTAYKQLPSRLLSKLNMKELKRIANVCPLVIEGVEYPQQ